MIKIQLIRHATVLLSINEKKILVDPYLANQGQLSPVPLTSNRLKNPLTPLPINLKDLKDVDAVLLTHCHTDHFDKAAKDFLSKNTLIFCQPLDEKKLRVDGFKNIKPIATSIEWKGLNIFRFNAHHGSGIVGKILANTSSFAVNTESTSIFFYWRCNI